MKITVQFSVKERMERLFEFLKKRAKDKLHKDNADLIADFIDKFIVVELKRLENNKEKFDEVLEVPNEVMLEPLKQMKSTFDKTFTDFLSGKGISVSNKQPTAQSTKKEEFNTDDEEVTSGSGVTTTVSKPRTGNGHAAKKVRNLNDGEKNIIKEDFLALNGQFDAALKDCQPILARLDTEITIFQVTGFVSLLHRYIREGKLTVARMDEYEAFIQNHRNLWSTYNSTKYRAMRQKAVNTTPKFTKNTFPKKTV